jgi:hypothetical protein
MSRVKVACTAATAEQLRGSQHSHVIIRAPSVGADMTNGGDNCDAADVYPLTDIVVNRSPLADLHHYADLWAIICSMLSGDALCCMARVSLFRSATRQMPSFTLLAGIDNDAQLVPWNDRFNVLSANYNPHCELCNTVYCRHQDNWDRSVSATIIAEALLSYETNHYPAYLQSQRLDKFRVFTGRGPARPPSPFDRSVSAYEPLNADSSDIPALLSPPLYGIRPGFSYAPFWSVLVGSDDSDDE